MERNSLKYLAKELGVTISTVSRALRGKHDVSESTRRRVQMLADEMGYLPNPYAGSLRNNKSRTIAVIVPDIENNFYSQVINGVLSVTKNKGYHLLVYHTQEDAGNEKEILSLLKNGRVDGMMISVAGNTADFSHIENCRLAGLPLVLFDRIASGLDVPSVTSNETIISLRATQHLLQRGCRRVAFLSPSPSLSISQHRLRGYLDALKLHNIYDAQQVVYLEGDNEINGCRISELLQRHNCPDGIFAAMEKFAITTYQVCDKLGIQIPNELKVISFSNLSASSLFDPPLTAITQPAYDMGKESASILLKIIDNKQLLPGERKVILPSWLTTRESSC